MSESLFRSKTQLNSQWEGGGVRAGVGLCVCIHRGLSTGRGDRLLLVGARHRYVWAVLHTVIDRTSSWRDDTYLDTP